MIYRIVKSAPGYPPSQAYSVGLYTDTRLRSGSYVKRMTDDEGYKWFASIEDARRAIPKNARQLPVEPEDQFIEVWEV